MPLLSPPFKNGYKKIVSVVPSQTELLYSLGLEEEVVGITKFCVHPTDWFRNKLRIGGTKNLNLDKIRSITPDLIIANKEENTKEEIELLAKDFDVYLSEVTCLQQAFTMIRDIGMLCDRSIQAEMVLEQIMNSFNEIVPLNPIIDVAYIIWKDPIMVAGGDTFINNMLSICGFNNVFNNLDRYPSVSVTDLINSNCKYIFLSSEPFPFAEKHLEEFKIQIPQALPLLVDGEFFSWYGSRLMLAPLYFQQLIAEVGTL